MKPLHVTFVAALVASGLAGCAAAATRIELAPPAPGIQNNQVGPVDLPRVRHVDHSEGRLRANFATYGQCQIALAYETRTAARLPEIPDEYRSKIEACLSIAASQRVNVLILPELSLAFSESTRAALLDRLRRFSGETRMVVVAGSYYDADRYSRIPVIGPGWEEFGYKMRPSRYEVSPREGFGMLHGRELLVVSTPFGRIAPITCVDLISDAVQFTVRGLASRGQVDVIANLNFNSAAWEFLVEANGIARRHPVFVSVTNVASSPDPEKKESCKTQGDNGLCFGNSALFASLRDKSTDCPNCADVLSDLVEAPFKVGSRRALPYDTLVAVVPPFQEAMLVYDLNLFLHREPASTNAPDQGYPTVRNVRRVPLAE